MTNTTIDETELNDLLGRFVADLGATGAAGNIVIGDRLGLYRALAEAGPLTSRELADYTGTVERYVREWLRGQAAGKLVSYLPDADQYWMTPAQALAFADPNGLVLPGAFQMALSAFDDREAIIDRFHSGRGFAWGEHGDDVAVGCERFFRPGYVANLVSSWLPAVDGLVERLHNGTAVADVGCGLGSSTRILAESYPASTVIGYDNDSGSIELARKLTAEAGLGEKVEFAVAAAADFTGSGLGLVTTFDCLHDMGDPVGAARHIRSTLAADGVWLIVEPYAGDVVADNLTPVGRLYYSLSTFLCVPHAIAEGAPDALGNQAGEQPIARVIEQAGFGRFGRVTQTPFNIVYEARP
ncbi:class I SAM-dependent methyltransferase [Occultella glacieicola]|uniref:class I SAM-dependent methyltransferase n=1 Tax=Occultella glacieicola TaxID=2518684 RepID=UPI001F2EFAB2|nr:class I SAM-dependent methyltransferase [Occultella glacieicola]